MLIFQFSEVLTGQLFLCLLTLFLICNPAILKNSLQANNVFFLSSPPFSTQSTREKTRLTNHCSELRRVHLMSMHFSTHVNANANTMDTATARTTTRTSITHAPPQMKPPSGTADRIPTLLQAIFLASNQGAVMNDAPLNRVASMEFSSGSSNNNNNMKKSGSFTVTKKRTPTKLALLKPVERSETMVRSWSPWQLDSIQ
jgi:hypothetical protein